MLYIVTEFAKNGEMFGELTFFSLSIIWISSIFERNSHGTCLIKAEVADT